MVYRKKNKIPSYPRFKTLFISDKKEIQKFTNLYPPYSDFNFLSLWSYNVKKDVVISKLFNNLVIRFRDYITDKQFYSFLGTDKVDQTINILLEKSEKEGLAPKLKLIPEINIVAYPELYTKYIILEDRDNYDYILSTNELLSLNGSDYYDQRKLVSRFKRRIPAFEARFLNLKEKNIQKKILERFVYWEEKKGRSKKEMMHELTAMKRTLQYQRFYNLISIGIFNQESLYGFIIADLDNSRCGEIHFLKIDNTYSGIKYLLRHLYAKEIIKKDCQLINIEQDMGLPGLRFAKLQSNPICFLKKYSITKIAESKKNYKKIK